VSLVKVITVTGLRFLTERGRESASGAFWRRSSGDFCGPGTLLRRTGDTITFDRRRYRSTNAQAEALNTKIKAFRVQLKCLQFVSTEKSR